MTTRREGIEESVLLGVENGSLRSILFPFSTTSRAIATETIADLYLDRIVRSILCEQSNTGLEKYFYELPDDTETISYRQAVFLDLVGSATYSLLEAFSGKLTAIADATVSVKKSSYRLHVELRLLDLAQRYIDLLLEAYATLTDLNFKSAALMDIAGCIRSICESSEFVDFCTQTRGLKARLGEIEYTLFIRDGTIRVEGYQGEEAYADEVFKLFSRFNEDLTPQRGTISNIAGGMDHIRAAILRLVSQVFPNEFRDLSQFHANWPGFINGELLMYIRELAFYLAVQKRVNSLTKLGNEFSIPQIYTGEGESSAYGNFDLALAIKLEAEGSRPIANDWWLAKDEYVIVVTGPNHGGKTTFARAFGQLHYMARLGCPVPAAKAKVQAFDFLITHFESEERATLDQGRLASDLSSAKAALDLAGPNSVLIFNEVFSSTGLQDAKCLGLRLLRTVCEKRSRAVYVTFVDELALTGPSVVSMAVAVAKDNPTSRFFTLTRSAPTGKSYALLMAEKFGLTRDMLKARLER